MKKIRIKNYRKNFFWFSLKEKEKERERNYFSRNVWQKIILYFHFFYKKKELLFYRFTDFIDLTCICSKERLIRKLLIVIKLAIK